MTAVGSPTKTAARKVRLFPLHMTSFEHYMFVDDRRRYPMTFIVELDFTGKIDRAAFEAAIVWALTRHPLLTACIGPGKQGKDCWIKAKNPRPLVDWDSIGEPIRFPDSEFIDLRDEIGLRIFVRHDQQRAIVTTQFHHATCDGIGSYQFLGDVLYAYAIETGDSSIDAPPELDPGRLKSRGVSSYNLNNFRTENGKYQRTWDEALRLLLRSNIVLRPEQRKRPEFQRSFPGIESITFDRREFKTLRLAAQDRGQVINDMLVEQLLVTLHQWHRSRGSWLARLSPLRRHACIMMPMNLRETEDNDISCCNVVAHSFLRRTAAQFRDQQRLRSELANELLRLKHDRHRIRFMHMLAGGHYFYPRTLKRSLDLKKCLATAILSNTGDPTRQFLADFPREQGTVQCGNLLLQDISGVPPLRPGTSATISIFTYRRNLKICMRCDPNQFSAEDTSKLLLLYGDNIRSVGSES